MPPSRALHKTLFRQAADRGTEGRRVPQQQRSFLFVVPPLAGHVNPTLGLGQALAERGHRVAWVGSEMFIRPLLGDGAEVFPTGSKMLRDQGAGGFEAVRSLWDGFIVPYARFTLRAVERAIADFAPDLVITDEHTPAGALAAQRGGVPWATLATSSMELGRPCHDRPEIEEWMIAHLRALWARAGLEPEAFVDPRASPLLVLALTSPALTGSVRFPDHYALVGPILGVRPPGPAFPWAALDPRRRTVLITMGTLAADLSGDFHRRVLTALAALDDVQGILVAPPDAVAGEPLPANVLTLPRVPILELFGRDAIDAVVCHGGLNTVTESLAHRVPLVLAPIRHDQPVTAEQVARTGAGIRVDFDKADTETLRSAIAFVLEEPAVRAAAGRVAARFAVDGGASAAVARLEAAAVSAHVHEGAAHRDGERKGEFG
jgi:MGT family glycosyltransferase